MKSNGERSLKSLNMKWLVLLAVADVLAVLFFVAPVLRPAIFQPLRPELFRGETKGKSHAVVGRSWPGIRVGQGAYRDRGSVFGKRHDSSGSYKFL